MLRTWHRRVVQSDDAGMTLIEIMVAMVVFGLVATGVAYGVEASTHSTRDSRMRIQAANLAAREIDIARNQFASTANGVQTLAATSVVTNPNPPSGAAAGTTYMIDGLPFTVVRTVNWLPAGSSSSACDGGSAVAFPSLAVNVTVTWTAMGTTRPVTTNTLLTPTKKQFDSTLGFLAVKVSGADGLGEPNVPVTLSGSGGTRTTGADGCTVFAVAPGTYTATLNSTGYVNIAGQSTVTSSTTVTSGGLVKLPLSYDMAATLRLTLSTKTGWNLPTTALPVTLYNSGLPSPYTTKPTGSGATQTVTNLWPFSSGYNVWSGQCNSADPSSGTGRAAATPLVGGGAVDVAVQVAPVTIHADGSLLGVNKGALANASILATPVVNTGCATAEKPLTLGVTDSAGNLQTSLPAGQWTLSVSGKLLNSAVITDSSHPLNPTTPKTYTLLVLL
jgi:prepilin-type N-terminal cleavage/methylation domain-containing protein